MLSHIQQLGILVGQPGRFGIRRKGQRVLEKSAGDEIQRLRMLLVMKTALRVGAKERRMSRGFYQSRYLVKVSDGMAMPSHDDHLRTNVKLPAVTMVLFIENQVLRRRFVLSF